MDALIGGGMFGLTTLLFWRILPRNGKVHPLVGTRWEPYIALLFVGGFGAGVGMIMVWAISNFA